MISLRIFIALAGVVCLFSWLNPAGAATDVSASPERGKILFKQCLACHQIGETAQNAFGPVLNGVVGRKAGSYPGYDYSFALQNANKKGLMWTSELIVQWLHGPSDFVRLYLSDPKTHSKMPIHIEDLQARRDVVAYLATITHQSIQYGYGRA